MTGSFDLFMRDPVDWFQEAARLTRLHHKHLTEQEPKAHNDRSPTGGRMTDQADDASTSGTDMPRPSCSVIVLDTRRGPT